ncbi:MAG: hypothetical protein ACOC12_00350 [Bacteroidota bacterium]
MKKPCLITIVLAMILFVGSQTYALNPESLSVVTEISDDDWTLNQSNNNVDFYHRIEVCDGQRTVLLMMVNRNDYPVEVSWQEVFTDKATQKNVQGYYGEKKVMIDASTTMQAKTCSEFDAEEFVIPLNMVTPTQVIDVQKFEFQNINVSDAR